MVQVYLVKGDVNITHYMGQDKTVEVTNLVYANSKEEADEKFRKYWESKTSDYDVYYRVYSVEVCETIR
jgi:hypothetical protein